MNWFPSYTQPTSQASVFFRPVQQHLQPVVTEQPKLPSESPVESSNDFKIVIILDESGSMESIRSDMIKAINDLIMEQKQVKERPCRLTLVKFNDSVTRTIKNMDIANVRAIKPTEYVPSGSTALYDAIGSTVDWFRYEKDVLMVIVTDGMENASRKYNKRLITEMLDEKEKHRNWSYVYLSNDLKTAAQGDGIGIKNSSFNSCNQAVDMKDYGEYCSKNLNSAISNYRKSGISVQQQLKTTPLHKLSSSHTKTWI